MRRLHLLFLTTAALAMFCGIHTASANTYYIAPPPTGSDQLGAGTLASPWSSLEKVWAAIPTTPAAHTVYVRGGTYYFTKTQYLSGKSGLDANNMIKVWAYGSEKPIIRPQMNYYPSTTFRKGIQITGNFIHIKGLEITGFQQPNTTDGNNNFFYGILAYDSNNNTFENLLVHHNGFGLSIGNNSSGNTILNSDFYFNGDPYTNFSGNTPWGGADGITIRTSSTSGINKIIGCRTWRNSDDGIDLYGNEGTIIIEKTWSFWNGYQTGAFTTGGDGNGIKLGISSINQSTQVRRVLRRNLIFQNRMRGVDQNNLLAKTELFNNTAFNNGYTGTASRPFDFWSDNADVVAKNNLAFVYNMDPKFPDRAIVDHNSFNKDGSINSVYTVTGTDFVSTTPSGVDGPRTSSGALPSINFLKLAPGSDLINSGTTTGVSGISFSGSNPDLGAFESPY